MLHSLTFANRSSADSLSGFGMRYVRVRVDGIGTAITALCIQSVGKGTTAPFTVQMQSVPALVSRHDVGTQNSDVDAHDANVAFLTLALPKPSQF